MSPDTIETHSPRELEADQAPASGHHLKPLSRATLPQEMVAAIADLIMKRVWRPGDRIPSEKELAARFRVGRSTIREAIKSLVILGVIEARPGDGSFIREATSGLLSGAFQWGFLLTDQNLGDLVDMRVLIEVECAGRAAAANDPDVGATLMQLLDRMREEQNHPQQFMLLDNQFHAAIAGAARNALYLSLSNTIQSLVSVWYSQTYRMEPTKTATIDEHFAVAAAIQANDEQAARHAMRQHILLAAERLQKVMSLPGGRDERGSGAGSSEPNPPPELAARRRRDRAAG
jgi:GntR family transcriptional repressor for pyruvate dehydrogenase complex